MLEWRMVRICVRQRYEAEIVWSLPVVVDGPNCSYILTASSSKTYPCFLLSFLISKQAYSAKIFAYQPFSLPLEIWTAYMKTQISFAVHKFSFLKTKQILACRL